MPPPMISLSTLADQVGEHRDLGRHLGAADHGRDRARRLVEHAAQRVDLLHQQRAGVGRQQARDGVGGGVRAMRGREGIADEDVAELGQLRGEGRIVLLLALVEAQVLQHGDVAVLQRGHHLGRRLADAVGREGDRLAEQLAQLVGHRLQRILRIGPALGPAEMRDDDRSWRRARPDPRRPGTMRSRRVASVTLPSLAGTLRSARTSTRLPFRSSPAAVFSRSSCMSG